MVNVLLRSALCERFLVNSGHIFGPIQLIYKRSVYFRLIMLCTKFGVDRMKKPKRRGHITVFQFM